MKSIFAHWARSEHIFCRHCSAVGKHECYLQQPLVDLFQLKENQPLLAICSACGGEQVFFAQDFRSLCTVSEFSCKIAGKGRLTVGDWVYIPGYARPGKVKARFRTQSDLETFVLEFSPGKEEKITQKIQDIAGQQAMRTYLLLPFQSAHSCIGDSVYHVNREKTGYVVGIIHDKVEKIIVKLDDESLLILESKNNPHGFENAQLAKFVEDSLQGIENIESGEIAVKVRQGVVFLSGACSSLKEKLILEQYVQSLEPVRAFISLIRVFPRVYIGDDHLEHKIHEKLFTRHGGVFGISLQVQNQVVTLHGYIQDAITETRIRDSLMQIEGIRELNMHLKLYEYQSFADSERSRVVTEALRKNGALDHARIRVATISGSTYLEGSVRTTMQKNSASLAAMWAGKNLKVVNNLKIDPSLNTNMYVKMV